MRVLPRGPVLIAPLKSVTPDCAAHRIVVPLRLSTFGVAVGEAAAEHWALLPPLLPVQLHDHGPEPLTKEAVPALQRLVAGALLTVVPFAEPQAPLTGAGAPQAGHVMAISFVDHRPFCPASTP